MNMEQDEKEHLTSHATSRLEAKYPSVTDEDIAAADVVIGLGVPDLRDGEAVTFEKCVVSDEPLRRLELVQGDLRDRQVLIDSHAGCVVTNYDRHALSFPDNVSDSELEPNKSTEVRRMIKAWAG
jgi:hypothetical protein